MRTPPIWIASWVAVRNRAREAAILAKDGPLDLHVVGRMLVQAAAVGVACGLVGILFLYLLDRAQELVLEATAGYVPLRARGEGAAPGHAAGPFRPLLLALLPAAGGLACGLLSLRHPQVRGGGGDVAIDAYHARGALLPAGLVPPKILASICTLGTGGAGGREGPTMLIGGAVGSQVARLFGHGERERRILMLAGIAAGISAVFRTPLGAALLAVEVLYRDGFESDALLPAILASVTSYSVAISFSGEATLFGPLGAFPFVPAHLPLFGLLALLVSLEAFGFVAALRLVARIVARPRLPIWLRPAVGGLGLGLLVTPVLVLAGPHVGRPGHGLGLLGGGYGAVQIAIAAPPWLQGGWSAVAVLAALALGKLVAAALTIGSGGSAGDFAPSLAMGGLLGGAFGEAARLLLADPRIDPAAFALVGMGAFYGGVAHVPLSAAILVCEMAGSYALIVPLMLALAISSVALRRTSLYHAQRAAAPGGGPPDRPAP
jgi:CIC family chloride channel protein